ncbi:MAG: class II glutamine amidotransferase [Planctomycetes bacterium]|nr:class II glutamine amidotransferase [Planctomycetota bacterium]
MCRFTLYLGPPIRLSSLVVEPEHSIITQSFRSRSQEEPLNGDGFGIAWYAPELSQEPALFRSVTPAWNNTNLLDLARVVQSPLILAHVRAATKLGGPSEANCHPFRSGRFAFMHNGHLGEFQRLRRPLLQTLGDAAFAGIHGSTDSEHLFAVVVDELHRAAAGGVVPTGAEAMARALTAAIGRVTALLADLGVQEPSYLNVAMSDGEQAVACRFTTEPDYDGESLYLHTGRVYVCVQGACRMLAPERGRGCVLVSSEPLSSDSGWEPLPRNTLVRIDGEGRTQLAALVG